MNEESKPITERRNELCSKLDGALPPGTFLKMLRLAEQQIFTGYGTDYAHVWSAEQVDALNAVIDRVKETLLLRDGAGKGAAAQGSVVLTGCGTSGRLAFLTARRYAGHGITYAIAGGDSALLLSDELPEDDAAQGARDVLMAVSGPGGSGDSIPAPHRVFTIGVTCGLSAPYVAGQMAAAIAATSNDHQAQIAGAATVAPCGAAMIGFNPVELAREAPIARCWPDGSEGTCKQVARCMALKRDTTKDARLILLNPVIGPEPVAGSSRMKGGSATLMLLDIICLKGVAAVREGLWEADAAAPLLSSQSVQALLGEYQKLMQCIFMSAERTLPPIMSAAASALREGGRVFYLGAGSVGVVGCIDLSEMPDTYGAPFDQMRAFVAGGWATIGAASGDLSAKSRLHRIDLAHFRSDVLPSVTAKDAVIAVVSSLAREDHVEEVMQLLGETHRQSGCRQACIAIANFADPVKGVQFMSLVCSTPLLAIIDIGEAVLHRHHEGFVDYAAKVALNAISTYAQAAGRGALFRGLMIATGPANDKIYQRCVTMVAEHVGVSSATAEDALIRAIYLLDELPPEFQRRTRADHIRAATLAPDQRHLPQLTLPIAFLLAIPPPRRWSVAAAREAALAEKQLSRLLLHCREREDGAPAQEEAVVIAVDVGGTNVRVGIIDRRGKAKLAPIVKYALGADRTPDGVAQSITQRVAEALAIVEERGGDAAASVCAIALAQPGTIHPEEGAFSHLSAFPEWGDARCRVRERIGAALPRLERTPVALFEDAESALAGEVAFGAARLARTAVAITVGTGVGCAVCFGNGRTFHRGARGLIELGHCIVSHEPDAPTCGCGQRGCVEAIAGGRSIASLAGEAVCEDVFDAAARGKEESMQALEMATSALAHAALIAVRAYDPDVIVFCGVIAHQLLPRIRERFKTIVWTMHDDAALVPFSRSWIREPGVCGAAARAFQVNRSSGEEEEDGSKYYLRRGVPRDLHALYHVCLKTGDAGADGSHLFSDPHLLGSIFTGPYLTHSPKFAFSLVKGDSDCVSGYVLGVLDTNEFNKRCNAQWWPRMREKYPVENLGQYRANEQELIRAHIHSRSQADAGRDQELLCRFPSHMHIDLLPEAQGRGFGTVMVTRLLDSLRGAGSCGVHLGMHPANERAFIFYSKLGFTVHHKGPDEWILVKSLVESE